MTAAEFAAAITTIVEGADVKESERLASNLRAELEAKGCSPRESAVALNELIANELDRRAAKKAAAAKAPVEALKSAVVAELAKVSP